MNMYVEIQIQLPANGPEFVAQWYAGDERFGQAFPLSNVGELLFFACFAEAPLISLTMQRVRCYVSGP